jgi:hypothetical protein
MKIVDLFIDLRVSIQVANYKKWLIEIMDLYIDLRVSIQVANYKKWLIEIVDFVMTYVYLFKSLRARNGLWK